MSKVLELVKLGDGDDKTEPESEGEQNLVQTIGRKNSELDKYI